MKTIVSRLAGAALLSAAVAACAGKGESSAADTTAALQMATPPASQPSLADTAAAPTANTSTQQTRRAPTPAPRRREPRETAAAAAAAAAPEPTEPARPAGEVASGASMTLHPTQRVCTNTNKIGDTVSATVAEAVPGTNGVEIPAGAVVKLEIVALKRSENVKDPIDMGFKVRTVSFGGHTYDLSATVTKEKIDRVRNEPTSKDVEKVVGGAVIGAVAGKLIGKDTKGAVVGAAAGAAAGAGVAAATANFEGCIAEGSDMIVQLTAPVAIYH